MSIKQSDSNKQPKNTTKNKQQQHNITEILKTKQKLAIQGNKLKNPTINRLSTKKQPWKEPPSHSMDLPHIQQTHNKRQEKEQSTIKPTQKKSLSIQPTQKQQNITTLTKEKLFDMYKVEKRIKVPCHKSIGFPDKKLPPNTKINIYKIDNRNIFPKELPVQDDVGKCGLMWPRGNIAINHPAAKFLLEYSTLGCPTDMGPDWTKEEIISAVMRGPHISAKLPDAITYLQQETEEKLKGGYINKVTWGQIKNHYPSNFKLSPLAMIPHKSRSYRCILDLSFEFKANNKIINSVNTTTNIKAPQKAMAQLGSVIKRIIYKMAANYDTNNPFIFSKCDVKDGFWRMIVSLKDAWNFAYVLPTKEKPAHIDDTQIIIPHALQMGWTESPPYFCSATETARDVIQYYYDNQRYIPPHPLEQYITSPLADTNIQQTPKTPTTGIEVYVDDFITVTNNREPNHLRKLARSMLHGIHSIFPPPTVTGHSGENPVSIKKLKQLEGSFSTTKEILGWLFNGQNFTIQLPEDKAEKIIDTLQQLTKQSAATLNQLEKIQGKLVHASLGIPGGRGLLSPLYRTVALQKPTTKISKNLQQCFKDWKTLIKIMTERPTSVLELIPKDPNYIGYVDSSKHAVGGVWTRGTEYIKPTVWRMEWPADIQERFKTADTSGDISINDLELAGIIIAWLVLEKVTEQELKHKHVGIFCDNITAVQWVYKRSTSTSTIAGHLLRALSLRVHINQAAQPQILHIPGEKNNMADMASRSFNDDMLTKSNITFLQHFSSTFPLQNDCWKEYHLPKKIKSKVISCLRGKPLIMALWMKIIGQDKNTGNTGRSTPNNSTTTHSSQTATTVQNNSSSSQPLLLGSGQATTGKETLFEFRRLHRRLRPYQRPSNWLGNNRQSTKQIKFTNYQWHGSLRDSDEKIHQQHHSSQFQSQFQKIAN